MYGIIRQITLNAYCNLLTVAPTAQISALVVHGIPSGTSGAQNISAPIRCPPSFEGTFDGAESPRSPSLYWLPQGRYFTRILSGLMSAVINQSFLMTDQSLRPPLHNVPVCTMFLSCKAIRASIVALRARFASTFDSCFCCTKLRTLSSIYSTTIDSGSSI